MSDQSQAIEGIGSPGGTRREVAVTELEPLIGERLGTSAWHEITQERISTFGRVTGDEQWIHVDPERAADGPFGGTIAHGYLTLALGSTMTFEAVQFTGVGMAINYGLDKVRFTAPVPSGSRVRAHVDLASARRRGKRFIEVILELSYEIEGSGEMPCSARTITLLQPAGE